MSLMPRPMPGSRTGHSRRARIVAVAVATAVLIAAAGVIVWRVLRPAEVVTPATSAYPEATVPSPGSLGTLVSAPLVVQDRIRIYAKKREVWSDGPASYHYERSAYWAYRRWPAQVTGLLAFAGVRPVAVSAWSDGMLVAIDAETGTVAWRADGEPLADEYTGRRTGAQTVYTPPGLFASGSRAITAGTDVSSYDARTGAVQWEVPHPVPASCRGTAFTTASRLSVLDTCRKVLVRLDLSTGRALPEIPADAVEPVSCRAGHSECAAMRVTLAGTVSGWVVTGASPVELPPLAAQGSLYIGERVAVPAAGSLSAVDSTGRALWTWKPNAPTPFRLLAADATRIAVLESDGMLAILDPRTGRFKSYATALMEHEMDRAYEVFSGYMSGSYLVLERVNPGVPATASDDEYYFTNRPVLLASAGPA
jgi:outer membrane protein assembly factor BamB